MDLESDSAFNFGEGTSSCVESRPDAETASTSADTSGSANVPREFLELVETAVKNLSEKVTCGNNFTSLTQTIAEMLDPKMLTMLDAAKRSVALCETLSEQLTNNKKKMAEHGVEVREQTQANLQCLGEVQAAFCQKD